MKKLKIGIIGCGGIANGKHMPALSRQKERAEMVAFCDLVVERAQDAAKKFGGPEAKVYTDFRQLIADPAIDVVHVCTPNLSHSEITVEALTAGKHVMCEKPMAINTADAEKMLDAARRSGKKLTVGYQNRFRNDSLTMKQAVLEGALGEVYYAKAHAIRRRAVPTWGVFLDKEQQGGGPLIDIGTHALDLTLWLMDNYAPKAVLGQTFSKLREQKNQGNAFGEWDPAQFQVEDSAFGFITMQNGATVVLESSWALNTLDVREAQATLCGTLGGLDTQDGLRLNKVEFGRQTVQRIDLGRGGVAFFDGATGGSPEDVECGMWLDAVLQDKQPLVLPEQAYTVTRILDAIYTSAQTGTAVYFDN